MKINSDRLASYKQPGKAIKLAAVAFSVIGLILMAISLFSYFAAKEVEQEYYVLVDDSMKKLELVSNLHNNEEIIYLSVINHLNALDSVAKQQLEASILKADNKTNQDAQVLKQMLKDPNNTALINNYLQHRSSFHDRLEHFLVLSRKRQNEEASAYYKNDLMPVFKVHQEYLHQLSKRIKAKAISHGNESLASFRNTFQKFHLFLFLAFAGVLISGLLIRKFVLQLKRDNALLNSEIRERQQLENALCQSQNQYKALFNSNPIPLLVFDQKSLQVLDVNDAAIEEYGFTKTEFEAIRLIDLQTEDALASFKSLLNGDSTVHLTQTRVQHKRKDGTLFYVNVETHALPAQDKATPHLLVATNIDEQIQVLEQLEKNEKQMREVSSSIPGAVYQLQLDADQKFKFNFISEGVERVFGIAAQELYDDPGIVQQYLHSDDVKVYFDSIFESYQTLEPWQLEFRVWNPKQHRYVWIKGSSRASKRENGVVIWNGTVIDIETEKEAQKKLIQSEANLLALLDSSPHAIYLLDSNLKIISYNAEAGREVREHLLQEIKIGESILDYIADAYVSETVKAHLKAFQGETVVFERRQGNLWFKVSFRPVKTPDKQVLAVALDIENISEQKQILETMRMSELQLERAQEMANLGNWEFDVKDSLLFWSDNVYKIHGINKKYYKPSFPSVEQYTHPDDREMVMREFMGCIEKRKMLKLEYRIVRPDGNVRNVIGIGEVIQDDNGRASKIWGSLQDITDRKNAERAVLDAKNLLQSTIENIPEIIFSTDAELKLTYVSKQCNDILGYSATELTGNAELWTRGIHRDDMPQLRNEVIRQLRAGQKQQFEVRAFTRDGSVKWLLLRMSPLLNENGEMIRIDGSAADMTYYKNAEAKRNELTEQLMVQNQNLQQFAYIVSHNLRAPIANILGLTHIYDRANLASDMNSKVIDNLVKSAQLLDSTIHDLNDILTLRNELSNLREQVQFEHVFQHIYESLSDEITKSGALISYDFSQAPELVTVKSYVQSIMLNLVSNALKYRADSRNLQLEVRTFKVPDYICLTVCDNGLGIDLEKEKNKIFGLYKRFHHSIEGKGLGLHLVKTQAELLGGKVDVESYLNVGSTFSVYFKV